MKHFSILTLSCIFLINLAVVQSQTTYEQAREALNSQDYAKAITLFKKDINQRNYSYSAVGLGLAYEMAFEKDLAIKAYESALSMKPNLDHEDHETWKNVKIAIHNLKGYNIKGEKYDPDDPGGLLKPKKSWIERKVDGNTLTLGIESGPNVKPNLLKSLDEH